MSFELPDPRRDEDAANICPRFASSDTQIAAWVAKLRDFAVAPRDGGKLALYLTREEARSLLALIELVPRFLIGTERPPEKVFEAFRRLHGID